MIVSEVVCLLLMAEGDSGEGTVGFSLGRIQWGVFGQSVKTERPIFSSPRKSLGSLRDSALSLNYAAM